MSDGEELSPFVRAMARDRVREVERLVAQCRLLLGGPDGMDQVQQFLTDVGAGLSLAFPVTWQLLGADDPESARKHFSELKRIVLLSPARRVELAAHHRLVAAFEEAVMSEPDCQPGSSTP